METALNSILEYNKQRPDNRIDIINISYGLSDQNKLLEEALARAYNSGITIIAAVGNNNTGVMYPAAYNFVIGVGAITPSKQIFPASNYGPGLDFMAPGESIFTIDIGGRYTWIDGGTSYAAAYISGVAALVIQAWQNKHGKKPDPAQVYETLKKISAPLPAVQADRQGLGLPDASKIPASV
jgi:subtilisin family serine protease